MHADVSARSITILGRLQGNVKVGERTEIRKTGSFGGDLLTAQIVIEDGAVFRGSIDIVKPEQNAANAPAGASAAQKQKGPGNSADRGVRTEARRFNGPQAVTLAPKGYQADRCDFAR